MSKHETITIGGRKYRKFIRYPSTITDGTCRCITCGQIDEQPWHDEEICRAERSKAWDAYRATHSSGGDRHD